MGERTSYEPGTFCWADLQTTGQEAAKQFYASLFGWEYEDVPVAEGVVYSMAKLDGKDVAAIAPIPPPAESLPPHWNSYVAVESADETTAKAQELGATVIEGPFDVFTYGRMAVLGDPQGAVFNLWEAREHIGARLVNAPGALSWNDLTTADPRGAAEFYGALFGWTFREMPASEDGPLYMVIFNGERSNGGILEQPEELRGAPPFWTVYFGAADADAGVRRAEELGGGLVFGPMDVPQARFAVLRDPQGAAFAVVQSEFDD